MWGLRVGAGKEAHRAVQRKSGQGGKECTRAVPLSEGSCVVKKKAEGMQMYF